MLGRGINETRCFLDGVGYVEGVDWKWEKGVYKVWEIGELNIDRKSREKRREIIWSKGWFRNNGL